MGYKICILGSSPNEWVAALELAKAGRQVVLIDTPGGALSTQEFHPGFKGELGLDSLRISPELVPDLKVLTRAGRTAVYPDGGYTRATRSGLEGRVVPEDARHWNDFRDLLDSAGWVLREGLRDVRTMLEPWRELGPRQGYEILRLPWMPVRDFLDEHFQDQGLKGLLATAALRGANQGPFACGTTFRLLDQWTRGELLQGWTATGGLTGLVSQLREQIAGLPIEVIAGQPTASVELDDDQIAAFTLIDTPQGGSLADGTRVEADFFLSGLDARQTFTAWLRPPQLETEWNQSLRHFRFNGCVARMLLAVDGLPRLTGLPEELLGDTLVFQPGLLSLEKTFDHSKYGRPAPEPWLEMTVPSLADPGLAPSGQHVVSLWIQYAPHRHGVRLEDAALALLRKFWPELDAQLLHKVYLGPAELAERLGLTEGHLGGGEATLDQSLGLRFHNGFAGLGSPFVNFDLCGASASPGGYQGWAGWRAARRYLDQPR